MTPKQREDLRTRHKVALDFQKRHIPTVSVETSLIIEISNYVQQLEASVEFLRQRKGESE